MTILLTGGAGFIGSHLARKLIEKGYKVIIVDNFNSYYSPKLKEARIKEFLKGLDFVLYREDIANFKNLEKIFSNHKIDKICHEAAQAGVRYSLENPFSYIESNIKGTLNLLELTKKYKVNHFIFASSSSVYGGNKKLPFSEKDPTSRPISLYAATKRGGELLAYTYYKLYQINFTILRYFTVYGPWGRPDMALFKFVKKILAEEPIEVYNKGQMKRDFTYIDDIVAGTLLSIEKVFPYEIINLGSGREVKLNYFIEVLEKVLGRKVKRQDLPLQPGDVKETLADIQRAKKLLSWSPKVSVEEGIKKFVSWYKEYQQLIKEV